MTLYCTECIREVPVGADIPFEEAAFVIGGESLCLDHFSDALENEQPSSGIAASLDEREERLGGKR